MSNQCCCLICGGISDGYHFGVASCGACSSFFRRTLAENKTYECRDSGQCPVVQNDRNTCRACRLQKCYQKGMKRQQSPTADAPAEVIVVGEKCAFFSAEMTTLSIQISNNGSPRAATRKKLDIFEGIWKTFCSSLKYLYTVQNPSHIFKQIQTEDYKLITKTEYDKLEKAAISIMFSQFLEHINPFVRASNNDRINIMRGVTRGISILFKAMMTARVFPLDANKIVMACGYYVNTDHVNHFFENNQGHENARTMVLPIIKKLRKFSTDIRSYRDLDLGVIVVLLTAQKMRYLQISTAEDEVYWKQVLMEVHTEQVKTFGSTDGVLRFSELLLNLFYLSNLVSEMNESVTVMRIFCPDNLMDVWDNIYSTIT